VELVILVLLVMLEPYINSRNLVIHSITSDLAASSRVLNRTPNSKSCVRDSSQPGLRHIF